MDFPNWAPKLLCGYYNEIPQTDQDKEIRDLFTNARVVLERMLTNATMIPVWDAFNQVDSSPNSALLWREKEPKLELFYRCLCCYSDSEHFPSRHDYLEKMHRIVKSATELLRAIKNTQFDSDPLLWFTESDQISILEKVGGKPVSSSYPMIQPDVKASHILGLLTLSVPINSKVSTILMNMVKLARAELDPPHGKAGLEMAPVGYRKTNNARANYFIRVMSGYFTVIFGTARYKLLGRLASAVLDDPNIDESFVRSTLSEYRKSFGHKSTSEE